MVRREMVIEKLVGGSALAGMVLAQAAPIEPWQQLTTTAACAVMLGWMIFRTLPMISENHRKSTEKMADTHRDAVKDLAQAQRDSTERIVMSIEGQTKAMRERDDGFIRLLTDRIQQR